MRIVPINSFEDYPMTWKPTLNREDRPIFQALAKQLECDIIEGLGMYFPRSLIKTLFIKISNSKNNFTLYN